EPCELRHLVLGSPQNAKAASPTRETRPWQIERAPTGDSRGFEGCLPGALLLLLLLALLVAAALAGVLEGHVDGLLELAVGLRAADEVAVQLLALHDADDDGGRAADAGLVGDGALAVDERLVVVVVEGLLELAHVDAERLGVALEARAAERVRRALLVE